MQKVNSEKIIGYFLILAGLFIIVYSTLNVINVFTGKERPFNLFIFNSISIDLGKLASQPLPNTPDKDFNQTLLEGEMLNKPMNLMAHLLLMGFLASIGFKIAQIGTMLVRTIKVSLVGKNDSGLTHPLNVSG